MFSPSQILTTTASNSSNIARTKVQAGRVAVRWPRVLASLVPRPLLARCGLCSRMRDLSDIPCTNDLVSFPDPAPLRGKEGLGTLVDILGILCVSNHVTHAYAHAHFSNKRVIRELRIVSCPGGGVWVAVTREFERDNCVISEILQSDWTIPNRAGVPRKSTKVPRPSFVRESREGLGPRLRMISAKEKAYMSRASPHNV